jgi:hypothetical protein
MSFQPQFVGRRLARRQFFSLAAGGAALALVACGDDDDPPAPTATAPTANTPPPASSATDTPENSTTGAQGSVIIGDVLEHSLDPDGWTGDFGFVTFRLHSAWVAGEPAYFIRCDASDAAFAEDEGLVHVPLMENALDAGAGYSSIYLFDDAPAGQLPVLSSAPHMDDYSPAYRVFRVRGATGANPLDSEEAIIEAADGGDVELIETRTVVNYPVVKWPGGEMPHDTVREGYLGDGQLLEPVDVDGETVKFKLHACYPASRYIVTDVSMAPMAPMMNIAPSPGTEPLTDAGATAKILVFGNGVEGSGPMGFQKSVTDTNPGDARWSSFWDHYTFVWDDAATPEVLKSEGAIIRREDAGELERFNGTPDTHPTVSVVNCPVPVMAPVS